MFSKDLINSQWRRTLGRRTLESKKTSKNKSTKTATRFTGNPYLNLLAMLGVVSTPAMSARQEEYLKKTSASRNLLSKLRESKRYQYQLPKYDDAGREISGRWVAIDNAHTSDFTKSRYMVEPSKMPLQIKRILTGLILRSSPFIQDLISKKGYDLLALLNTNSKSPPSSSYSDQSFKDSQISELFEELLDKKFAYFSKVQEVLRNFFDGLNKGILPSSLSKDDQQELTLLLRQSQSGDYSQNISASNSTFQNSNSSNSTQEVFIETTAPFDNPVLEDTSSSRPIPTFDEDINTFERQISEFRLFLINQRILREAYPDRYPKLISLNNTKFFGMKFLAPKISYEPDIKKSFLSKISKDFLEKIDLAGQVPARSSGILKDLDLSNLDLTGLNLDNLIFENCNLRGSVIPSANNLQIIGCDLRESKWVGRHTNLMIGHNRFTLNQQIIFVRNALSRLQYSMAFKDEDKARILFDLTNLFIVEIYRSNAASAKTTNCSNADFSESFIEGFVASKADFTGAKFSYFSPNLLRDRKFFGNGAVFFSDCQNLVLPNAPNHHQESFRSFDFEAIKEKYQKIYGKNIVELVLKSFGDFQLLPIDFIKKLASKEKITIALSFANSTKPMSVSATNIRFRDNIVQYLNDLFDQKNIEFVVDQQNDIQADFRIKVSDELSSGNADEFAERDIYLSENFMSDQTKVYFDQNGLITTSPKVFNSRYALQGILSDVLFEIADPNYFEKIYSIGEISAFSSGFASIDSLSIVSDGKVENIVLDPSFQRWLKPADYLATRMYLEALGRFSEDQQIKSDLLVNITSLDDVKSGVIFQKSPQALNAFTVSDKVVSQCQKISVHKAKDLVKYCYFYNQQNCQDNSFIGEDDQAILFELKTGEKKLILLSGGQKKIAIGYPDTTIKTPESSSQADFDKSKLAYLAFIGVLSIPCLIIAVKNLYDQQKKQHEDQPAELGLDANLEFVDQQKKIIKIKLPSQNQELEFENTKAKKEQVISDFTNLSNLYFESESADLDQPIILAITSDIFEKNKDLIIKVSDIDSSYLQTVTKVFDPQEKLKLITFKDTKTNEEKFIIARGCQDFQVRFYKSELTDDSIELPAKSAINANKISLPLASLSDLERFKSIEISDPTSEFNDKVKLFFSEDHQNANIDLKKLKEASVKVLAFSASQLGIDIVDLNDKGISVSDDDFIYRFELKESESICYGFFKRPKEKHRITLLSNRSQELQCQELQFTKIRAFTDYVISDFTNLSNLYFESESADLDQPIILAITSDIFKKNKDLIIKVSDIDSSYLQTVTKVFDPQEKLKLITFKDTKTNEEKFIIARGCQDFQVRFYKIKDTKTNEEKFIIARGCQDFQVRFYKSELTDDSIELPAESAINANKISLPLASLSDLERFKSIEISDPTSEFNDKVKLFFSEDHQEVIIDFQKINYATDYSVSRYFSSNLKLDIDYLKRNGIEIGAEDHIFEFKGNKGKYYAFFKDSKTRVCQTTFEPGKAVVMSSRPEGLRTVPNL